MTANETTPAVTYLQRQFDALVKVRESLTMTPQRKHFAGRMAIGYDRTFFLKVANLFYVFCQPATKGNFNEYDRYTVIMQSEIPELGAPVATGLLVSEVVRFLNASALFNDFPDFAHVIQVKDEQEVETINTFIQHLLQS